MYKPLLDDLMDWMVTHENTSEEKFRGTRVIFLLFPFGLETM